MRIREYTPADFDALRRLHAAQGFGYPLPDLESPLFVSKLVLEDEVGDAHDENGDAEGREEAHRNSLSEPSTSASPRRITMAVLLRLTAETYLLHDPAAGTPVCAGSDSSHSTKPCGTAPPREASTTFRHFSRRAWRAPSAAA
jgi:hypothetical protein